MLIAGPVRRVTDVISAADAPWVSCATREVSAPLFAVVVRATWVAASVVVAAQRLEASAECMSVVMARGVTCNTAENVTVPVAESILTRVTRAGAVLVMGVLGRCNGANANTDPALNAAGVHGS